MPLNDLPCARSYVLLNVIVSTNISISLQWSPTEADIFSSCSVNGTIPICDIRTGKKPHMSVKAHKYYVNVISWNRYIDWKALNLMSTITPAA
jgi:WD40 repeat protein